MLYAAEFDVALRINPAITTKSTMSAAQRDDLDPDAWMQQFANRVRAELAERGWSQEQLEQAAGFAGGTLSRLLRAKQRQVWPRTIKRIAEAFQMTPDELLRGGTAAGETEATANGGRLRVVEGSGRTLSQIEGYANAELAVGRREPAWPVEAFEMARATRLHRPPATVTIEFLHDFVGVLVEHVFQNPSAVVSKAKTASGRGPAGRREAAAKRR